MNDIRHAIRSYIFTLSLLVVVTGCVALPQARYYKDNPPNKSGIISFNLNAAMVTIAVEEKKATADTSNAQQKASTLSFYNNVKLNGTTQISDPKILTNAKALVTPTSAKGSLRYMEPQESVWVQPNFTVSYYENSSHLVKQIGTDLVDNRVKIINAVGGTLLNVAIRVKKEEERIVPLKLPLVLDFSDPEKFSKQQHGAFSKEEQISQFQTDTATVEKTDWWYRYKLSKPEGRVFLTEEYFKKNDGKYISEFPISACTTLTLQLYKGKDKKYGPMEFVLQIPDPSYVEPFRLPAKGSIKLHSICGADITGQTSMPGSDQFEVIEAISSQVNALWNAQQKH